MPAEVVHAISCLVPSSVISDKSGTQKRFKQLIQLFHDANWISAVEGDKAKIQFNATSSAAQVKWKNKFELFDENESRLDDFYYDLIGKDDFYKECWAVVRICLVFSHGQVM